MASKPWSRDDLILAMNLYCRLPFGLFHQKNSEVIALANAIERTPSSVAMKLCNLASLDPYHRERGVKGLEGASRGDRAIWDEFHADWESLAVQSEQLRESLGLSDSNAKVSHEPEAKYTGETEFERPVRVRLAQRFFRQSVLAAYESRCCVTGVDLPQLLIASRTSFVVALDSSFDRTIRYPSSNPISPWSNAASCIRDRHRPLRGLARCSG